MLEDGICGWTQEHHKKIAINLKKFAEQSKEKIIVKLHPRSSKVLWDSYNFESKYFEVVKDGDFTNEMKETVESGAALQQVEKFSPFQITGKGKSTDKEGKYILIGKGYYGN